MASNWHRTEIGNHIDLLTGFPFSSEYYTEDASGVRLLRGDNVIQGTIRWEDAKRWPVSQIENLERYQLAEDDIVIAMDRTWVKAGLKISQITKRDTPSLLVQRVARLRAKGELDQNYLTQCLNSYRFEQHVKGNQTETAVPHISSQQICDFTIPFPRIEEQREIAAILRTWDEAIELHDALAEQLQKQHTALIHQLVFGGFRLAPYTSNQKAKKYRWFNLPSGWQCNRIGVLAHEVSERNREDEAAEILSCSKYDGFVRSLDYFKKQVFSSDLTGYKRIHLGDFGFPSNHVEEGSIGLQNIADIGLVSPIYTVFRFSAEKIDNEYAYYVLKTGLYRHIFEVNTSASVDRRGSLRWDEFATIPFPVPSLEEQREIVKVLHASAKRLSVLRDERDLLERQKRGLMQKLLTGEWRVKL